MNNEEIAQPDHLKHKQDEEKDRSSAKKAIENFNRQELGQIPGKKTLFGIDHLGSMPSRARIDKGMWLVAHSLCGYAIFYTC